MWIFTFSLHDHARFLYERTSSLQVKVTHLAHINTMGVGPETVETLLNMGPKWVRDAVKPNELLDLSYLSMIPSLRCVQSIDNNGHITKDTGIN